MAMHQQNMNLHDQSNTKKIRTGTKKPKKRMDPTMMSIYEDLQKTMDADAGNVCGTKSFFCSV
uniref:Uncharacterized protein n=1 Tax=Oryza glumipatula TaxID=40148 RepID=A0A0D9ZIJ3_9ORYZ